MPQHEDAGAAWVRKAGLQQINFHTEPGLHDFLVKLSEGLEMSISDIMTLCIRALKDEATRKKVLGMDGKVQGVREG